MWSKGLTLFIFFQIFFTAQSYSSNSYQKDLTDFGINDSLPLSPHLDKHSPLHQYVNPVPPQKARLLLYEGNRSSKNGHCFAKLETYGKTDSKEWYYSVGDMQVRVGYEPEYVTTKPTGGALSLTGAFHSYRIGDAYKLPNMIPTSSIRASYDVSSELILEDDLAPRAYSLRVKNKNFMREFSDQSYFCYDLKLVKYWPCYQAVAGFENRNGWCTRSDVDPSDSLNF